MSQPLLTIGPGKELESGLYVGVDKLSAPFWADGMNVEFRAGGPQTSSGYEEIATLPGEIIELAQAYVNGDKRIYGGYDNQVFMSSSLTGLSPLGSFPTNGTPYFETFGSFLLGTNGVDPVRVWRNAGTFDVLAGVPFSYAKLLHRKDNHIMALNTSNGQNAYEWCSASDIDDWNPTIQNSAGSNFIRDLDSEIVAVCDLGPAAAVYSRETMGVIQYVGQPNIFSHQPAINGVGAVGAHSVVQIGVRNAGLNRQGIFITDGVSFDYADDPAIHDYLIDNVDFDRGEEIRGYHNEIRSSVIWYFWGLDGIRHGVGFDYKKGIFKLYDPKILVGLERQVFDVPVAAVEGKKLVLLDQTENRQGAAFSKWVRTKPISAGDGTLWKNWSHLKLVGKWNDAQVKIGVMEDPNSDTIEWFSTQDMAFEIWIDRDAPFLVLEFRADNVDSYFRFSQLQLMGSPAGLVSA